MDRTLILVKPDAFARNLTGEIIARFERKGLRIVALKLMTVDDDLARRHYAEHDGKPFFGELVEFITSGPLVAMVLEGEQAVTAARQGIVPRRRIGAHVGGPWLWHCPPSAVTARHPRSDATRPRGPQNQPSESRGP